MTELEVVAIARRLEILGQYSGKFGQALFYHLLWLDIKTELGMCAIDDCHEMAVYVATSESSRIEYPLCGEHGANVAARNLPEFTLTPVCSSRECRALAAVFAEVDWELVGMVPLCQSCLDAEGDVNSLPV